MAFSRTGWRKNSPFWIISSMRVDIHVDDAAGADVEVADFAVAHLPVGQADVRAAGLDERVGILAQQPVIGRLARERDGVGLGFGAVSPAVEDDKYEWFRTRHKVQRSAVSS